MIPERSDIQAVLDVTATGPDTFRAMSPKNGWRRVFGGQVIGQALVAANLTIAGRAVHSLHAYFMRPGDPAAPIDYGVERLRDGSSFSTRRVVARQGEEAIFAMAASFHREEAGLEHQIAMPAVPAPEHCLDEAALEARYAKGLPKSFGGYWRPDWPIEMRLVAPDSFFNRRAGQASQHCLWMRARAHLPDDQAIHRAVLAYASDYSLIDTALVPHGRALFDPAIQIASLDHAMWFHRSFRADDWVLYVQDSPWTGGARGLCRGSIFSRDGALVATLAQEGLMRQRDPEKT